MGRSNQFKQFYQSNYLSEMYWFEHLSIGIVIIAGRHLLRQKHMAIRYDIVKLIWSILHKMDAKLKIVKQNLPYIATPDTVQRTYARCTAT